jgi:hypothetical protein
MSAGFSVDGFLEDRAECDPLGAYRATYDAMAPCVDNARVLASAEAAARSVLGLDRALALVARVPRRATRNIAIRNSRSA